MNITPKKTVLKNGIRLLTARNTGTSTVTVLMFFKTGSRYENPKIQGISHFLEHMMFKGTKKRPDATDISRKLDAIGAEYNAFTNYDYTGYYVKASAKYTSFLFDILSDILLNSVFKNSEIQREKGPVIEEIKMYDENPMYFVDEASQQTLFGNTNLGRSIAGSAKTVASLTRNQVVDYYNTHYYAQNLIVGVAGNFEEKNVQALIKKHLNSLKKGEKQTHVRVVPIISSPRVNLQNRKLKQINASIAFPMFDANHKDAVAARLLSVILGGGMSSRLFVSVRERKGLCYYIRTSTDFYEETGGFFIKSGLDAKRLDLALSTILAELGKIKKKPPTNEELKDAKEQVKGRLMINLEDSFAVAEMLVTEEAFKNQGAQDIRHTLAEIDKVTPTDIQRVAKEIFKKSATCLTMVGPLKNPKHFTRIIEKSTF